MSYLPWPEAPRVDKAIYADEYLEYWADRYVFGLWLYRGVSLMQFLARPRAYEAAAHSLALAPLLGKQRRIQQSVLNAELHASAMQTQRDGEPLDLAWITQRAERGLEQLPRRNGAIIEPLHHRTHPRSALANFAYKQGARR